MTKKEKIFKALWHKNSEEVLSLIYQREEISFKGIAGELNYLAPDTIRAIINRLVKAKLIKNVKDKNGFDGRNRVYKIKDETAVIGILELEL